MNRTELTTDIRQRTQKIRGIKIATDTQNGNEEIVEVTASNLAQKLTVHPDLTISVWKTLIRRTIGFGIFDEIVDIVNGVYKAWKDVQKLYEAFTAMRN